MKASLSFVELTTVARDLGFEVICHEEHSPVDRGVPLSIQLHGNEVHFGGTLGECAAFLVGWGALRTRMLGELRAVEGQVEMEMEMGEQLQEAVSVPVALSCRCPRIQEVTPSCGAPRGTDSRGRVPTRKLSSPSGRSAGLTRGSSAVRPGESTIGDFALERLLPRDRRQAMILAWAELAFGREEATGIPQRGLRLLEEAIEVFQACRGTAKIAHELVTFVFKRPCGSIGQELGGVAVSLLALAAASGLSAEVEECREIHRVLTKPVEEFSRRNAVKSAAGFPTATAPGVL